MQIQIEVTNARAARNFAAWFRKEGFKKFIKSKYNKLNAKNIDAYITCLAADEELNLSRYRNEYSGQYFELQ